jgi:hypothetical protein
MNFNSAWFRGFIGALKSVARGRRWKEGTVAVVGVNVLESPIAGPGGGWARLGAYSIVLDLGSTGADKGPA